MDSIRTFLDLREELGKTRDQRDVEDVWTRCRSGMSGEILKRASIYVHGRLESIKAQKQTRMEEWLK